MRNKKCGFNSHYNLYTTRPAIHCTNDEDMLKVHHPLICDSSKAVVFFSIAIDLWLPLMSAQWYVVTTSQPQL